MLGEYLVFIPVYIYRSRYGRDALLTYLAEHTNADINCITANGQTAFDFIQSSDGICHLLKLGARPTYDLDEQYFPSYLRQGPAEMSIKMFVLGNSETGKSTLSKSLKSERNRFSRFKSRYIKVKGVDRQTAGIIPHDIVRKAMGSVTIFDFAGNKVFYAGHDALLCNSMANSPSIIMLMVDLRDEEGKFRETLLYWLEFISDRCSERGSKPHLILIGSHADHSKDVQMKSQLIKSLINSSKLDGFTFIGQVILDCRFAESSSMTELCSMLSQCCHSIRSSQETHFESQCFLLFLLNKFKDKSAITLAMAKLKINESSRDEIYLNFLKSHNLLEICEQLNGRGNIIFMKNHKHLENSWIILNKVVLLSHVCGVIFAPEGFKEHQKLATKTGVVPLSKIVHLFPNFDPDMVIQFLCHMRFCQEIPDHRLLSNLQADDMSTPLERYFLFPGLIQLNTPSDLWQPSSDWECHSGWLLHCFNPEQVLSSRFVQILLTQLFTLATSHSFSPNHPAIMKIWKNGISWTDKCGAQVTVEVVDQRSVIVLTRCKQLEKLEMVQLRSAIIRRVLDIGNEICPKVSVQESVISPEDAVHYPLDPTKVAAASLINIARAVKECETLVVMKNNQTLELESLLQFEPYAHLGKQVLHELFDKDNHREITDQFLRLIVDRVPHKAISFKAVMKSSPSQVASIEHGPPEYSHDLLRVFQAWRDESLLGGKKQLRDFCDKLDQFSIFAGRNPLDFS